MYYTSTAGYTSLEWGLNLGLLRTDCCLNFYQCLSPHSHHVWILLDIFVMSTSHNIYVQKITKRYKTSDYSANFLKGVYFKVLMLLPRSRVAGWPKKKILSIYPRGSMAKWPKMIFFIFYRGQ